MMGNHEVTPGKPGQDLETTTGHIWDTGVDALEIGVDRPWGGGRGTPGCQRVINYCMLM